MKGKIFVFLLIVAISLTGTTSTGYNIKANNQFTHAVFAEIGVDASQKSISAENMLYGIYLSKKYPFYYVSMVSDEMEEAKERMEDYNICGYPTAFFEGGKEVIYGVPESTSYYEDAIISAGSRETPNVEINLTAEWILCPCQRGITAEVTISNYEPFLYKGTLIIYITEIYSRWGSNSIPYHFGFMGYALNESIVISPHSSYYTYGYWNPEAYDFHGIEANDMSNFMVFAVLFNQTEHDAYAFPPDKNLFHAYYVDSTAAYRVENSNLPPIVKITEPEEGYIYFYGRQIMESGETILIGDALLSAYASDDFGVKKVEFYVDDELKKTITEKPYQWAWDERVIGKHEIKAVAYDEMDSKASDKIQIKIFNI